MDYKECKYYDEGDGESYWNQRCKWEHRQCDAYLHKPCPIPALTETNDVLWHNVKELQTMVGELTERQKKDSLTIIALMQDMHVIEKRVAEIIKNTIKQGI